MTTARPGYRALLEELKRRRVVRAVLAYSAAVFALLQVAQPVFDGLMLPDLALRVLVLLALAGYPVVIVLAWVYELTADGLRRTPAGPDVAAAGRRVPVRRWLQVAGIFLLFSLLAAGTAAGVGRLRFPGAGDDGRVGLAIFPFRATDPTEEIWSSGVADLLATALDGTVGLRILDPWALWRPLRPVPEARAPAPEPARAAELAARAGAHRYLLGSVVPSGDRVDVSIRLYRTGRTEPIATVGVSGAADGVADIVRDAAVHVLTRVWGPREPGSLPTAIDFDATRSPEALKAYIAARDALRRGALDSANTAIDRAVALDSTFVLALVEAIAIKSWGFNLRGQPYSGFFELLERGRPQAQAAHARTRLRFEAMEASVRTEGARAHAALQSILELDPDDLAAHSLLTYVEMVYGWQFGVSLVRSRDRAEAVVRMDSTFVPHLVTRAWWAAAMGDTADQRQQLARIERTDTAHPLGRAWRKALQAGLADDAGFATMLPDLAGLPPTDRLAVMRVLRAARLDRMRALAEAMRTEGDPLGVRQAAGERLRLDVAAGRTDRVEGVLADRDGELFRTLQFLTVAASLADIGTEDLTRRVVDDLADWLVPDSMLAHFGRRPIWWGGWLIGAHHAMTGDTMTAHRWIRALGLLPPGGSPREYARALQADIAARLAARRGEFQTALREARRAGELWSIHSDVDSEWGPAPVIRFHLGQLHRRLDQPDSAHAMFSSLVPPATWLGVLTARASYELGRIEADRGDLAMAALRYRRALEFWDDAGPGAIEWQRRTRDELVGQAVR